MKTENENRLEAFEKMLEAVQKNYKSVDDKMKQLKAEGKEKTATYQSLSSTHESNLSSAILVSRVSKNIPALYAECVFILSITSYNSHLIPRVVALS